MATFQYLKFCSEEEQPSAVLRNELTQAIRTTEYSELNDGNPSLQTLCYSLSNLSMPIKLVRPKDVFKLGRFPRYDDCDNESLRYTKLDQSTFLMPLVIVRRTRLTA